MDKVKCQYGGYCNYDDRPETIVDCTECSRYYQEQLEYIKREFMEFDYIES